MLMVASKHRAGPHLNGISVQIQNKYEESNEFYLEFNRKPKINACICRFSLIYQEKGWFFIVYVSILQLKSLK